MTLAVNLAVRNDTASIAGDLEIETQIAEAARFVRRHTIASIYRATSGHPGGSLSCADILACLFGAEMNVWPSTMHDPKRDRFVLSKGHAAPALYAIGAHYGFCDKTAALALRSWEARSRAIRMFAIFHGWKPVPVRSVRGSPSPSAWRWA